ncbi:uncharacterized protein LOC112512720 [Cynara cardunculus var. scolymus]|uniref:uncharacterized protein LOC112512720 n=1 Tax=Cynara cardunculus var. scolymus TaxID=59895 RepID=UPI000D62E4D2|nr:uncharacterized protein LOC112512720 [Cynara cardunculus var. scolymus]
MSSGLGGLGLDGMVGSEDSVGESWVPLGEEGKSGVMSGDEAGEGEAIGDDGVMIGSNAGAAEMLLSDGSVCANDDENWKEKNRRQKAI